MNQLPTTPHPPQLLLNHPVDQVVPHPRNARLWNREAIRASLEDNDQYKPLVVQRSTGYILAGNGTYTVARQDLGWDAVHVLLIDVDDVTATRILLADNKIPDGSGYLTNPLAELLAELAALPGGLSGTGYGQDELDQLLADAERDASRELDNLPAAVASGTGTDHDDRDRDRDDRDDHDGDGRGTTPRGAAEGEPEPEGGVLGITIRLPVTVADHDEYRRLVDAARETLGDLPAPQVVLRALAALVVLADWAPQLSPEQVDALAAIGIGGEQP